MRNFLILMSFAFYFLMAQSFAQVTDDVLQDMIKSQNMIYMIGFKEKNAEKVASVHTMATRFFPPNRAPAIGRAAVIEIINDEVAAVDVALTLETQSLERQGDAVLEIGKYSVQITLEDGMVINDEGNTVVIWKQDQSGQWLMDLDIWNSTAPLMY